MGTNRDKQSRSVTIARLVEDLHGSGDIDGNEGVVFHPKTLTITPKWEDEIELKGPNDLSPELKAAALMIAKAMVPLGRTIEVLLAFSTPQTTFLCFSWLGTQMLGFDLNQPDACIQMIRESIKDIDKQVANHTAAATKQGQLAS